MKPKPINWVQMTEQQRQAFEKANQELHALETGKRSSQPSQPTEDPRWESAALEAQKEIGELQKKLDEQTKAAEQNTANLNLLYEWIAEAGLQKRFDKWLADKKPQQP